MRKSRIAPILSTMLVVCLIAMFTVGSSPVAEGQYMQVRIDAGIFQSTSYLGDQTEIQLISLHTTTGENYAFTATGETILNIPENAIVDVIRVNCRIDDNYASSVSEAEARTRIEVTLTDASSVVQFADNFESTDNAGTFYLPLLFPNYYWVLCNYGVHIPLTPGTWDLDAEYFIFATPI